MIGTDKVQSLVEFNEDGTPVIPFYHQFPKTVADALANTPVSLLDKTEDELDGVVEASYADRVLKKRFWKEFKEADKTGRVMKIKNICQGVMNPQTFNNKIKGQAFAAWLIAPSISYVSALEGYITDARKRYEDLLAMDINKYSRGERTEEVDPKKAMVLLSVIKNLEDRTIGGALQRQISVSTKEPDTKEDEKVTANMEAIDKRLNELALQLGEKQVRSSDEIIEAEVISCEQSSVHELTESKE